MSAQSEARRLTPPITRRGDNQSALQLLRMTFSLIRGRVHWLVRARRKRSPSSRPMTLPPEPPDAPARAARSAGAPAPRPRIKPPPRAGNEPRAARHTRVSRPVLIPTRARERPASPARTQARAAFYLANDIHAEPGRVDADVRPPLSAATRHSAHRGGALWRL